MLCCHYRISNTSGNSTAVFMLQCCLVKINTLYATQGYNNSNSNNNNSNNKLIFLNLTINLKLLPSYKFMAPFY